MEKEISKSFHELVDKIRGETLGDDKILQEILNEYLKYTSPSENQKISFKKLLVNLFSTSQKSEINTIRDLVDYLENKNIISERNIQPLEIIVSKLNNHQIEALFKKHDDLLNEPLVDSKSQTNLEQRKGLKTEVKEVICREISIKRWKKVGRHLKLSEQQLDAIEMRCKDDDDYSLCAAKMLECFEMNTEDSSKLDIILYGALIEAKRKDLADTIKPLLELDMEDDNCEM